MRKYIMNKSPTNPLHKLKEIYLPWTGSKFLIFKFHEHVKLYTLSSQANWLYKIQILLCWT